MQSSRPFRVIASAAKQSRRLINEEIASLRSQ